MADNVTQADGYLIRPGLVAVPVDDINVRLVVLGVEVPAPTNGIVDIVTRIRLRNGEPSVEQLHVA